MLLKDFYDRLHNLYITIDNDLESGEHPYFVKWHSRLEVAIHTLKKLEQLEGWEQEMDIDDLDQRCPNAQLKDLYLRVIPSSELEPKFFYKGESVEELKDRQIVLQEKINMRSSGILGFAYKLIARMIPAWNSFLENLLTQKNKIDACLEYIPEFQKKNYNGYLKQRIQHLGKAIGARERVLGVRALPKGLKHIIISLTSVAFNIVNGSFFSSRPKYSKELRLDALKKEFNELLVLQKQNILSAISNGDNESQKETRVEQRRKKVVFTSDEIVEFDKNEAPDSLKRSISPDTH